MARTYLRALESLGIVAAFVGFLFLLFRIQPAISRDSLPDSRPSPSPTALRSIPNAPPSVSPVPTPPAQKEDHLRSSLATDSAIPEDEEPSLDTSSPSDDTEELSPDDGTDVTASRAALSISPSQPPREPPPTARIPYPTRPAATYSARPRPTRDARSYVTSTSIEGGRKVFALVPDTQPLEERTPVPPPTPVRRNDTSARSTATLYRYVFENHTGTQLSVTLRAGGNEKSYDMPIDGAATIDTDQPPEGLRYEVNITASVDPFYWSGKATSPAAMSSFVSDAGWRIVRSWAFGLGDDYFTLWINNQSKNTITRVAVNKGFLRGKSARLILSPGSRSNIGVFKLKEANVIDVTFATGEVLEYSPVRVRRNPTYGYFKYLLTVTGEK